MTDHQRYFRRLGGAALLAACAASSLHSLAATDSYRWVDANGEAVYSDRPPPAGTDYEIINASSGLRLPVTAAAVDDDTEGAADGKAPTSGLAKAGANAELCEQAKLNLIALEGAAKVNVRGEDGTVKALTAEDRDFALKSTKAQISVYCAE